MSTLSEKMKAQGLKAGEEFAELSWKHVVEICKVVVEDTDNDFDNAALSVVLGFEGLVKDAMNKIDGDETT